MTSEAWLAADWPAPAGVRTLLTTRNGGVSTGAFSSLNLGEHVGDDPVAVAENRARLRRQLPAEPLWLNQVHGNRIVDAAVAEGRPDADASVARRRGLVCSVLTADCLPLLLCDRDGGVVAAVHAGWRGLCHGVIENAVAAMGVPGERLLAYLGPAIGPESFEVGDEVRAAFLAVDPAANAAFKPTLPGKWLADIYLLARQRLGTLGVEPVYGGGRCTLRERETFFSYRRDGPSGRMASLIWIE